MAKKITPTREIILPKLEIWQQEAYEQIANQKGSGKIFTIKSGRQRGKNFLINTLLLSYSLMYPGGISILIEPTIAQCGRVYNQIKASLEQWRLLKSWNGTSLTLTFSNNAQIIFKSAEQKDALRGLTCSNILIFDEAAFIPDDIIEILLPLTNVNKCPVLYTSTPLFADGYFYKMYMRGLDKRTNATSFDWNLNDYDMSKYLPQEQLDFYKQNYSELKFKTEILGEFVTDGGGVFNNYKNCIGEPSTKDVFSIGVDWATGAGRDATVATLMNHEGEVVKMIEIINKTPTAQVKELAKIINRAGGCKKVMVEMNSIGSIYYDMLLNLLNDKTILVGFNTTNASKRRIIEQLAAAFQSNEITIPDTPNLNKQLASFVIKKTKSGGYTYENFTDSIHDDYVMSLAICYEAYLTGGSSNVAFGFQ